MKTNIHFYKYHGTGNDFIMVDNRSGTFPKQKQIVAQLCDRRFGIGADGLILLEFHNSVLKMVYYNSDGGMSSMCGNGGRCFAAFAVKNNLAEAGDSITFEAADGLHDAFIKHFHTQESFIDLKMKDVHFIKAYGKGFLLDTGSPHYVEFVENDSLKSMDLIHKAKEIRYNSDFKKQGVNVNFLEFEENRIKMRTYERGVEDETFSCGTGVTAAALVLNSINHFSDYTIETKGGNLEVRLSENSGNYQNIWLCGPATFVFEGDINIEH